MSEKKRRPRYRIRRLVCGGCDGVGVLSATGDRCPFCYGGALWVLSRRRRGNQAIAYTASFAEAIAALDGWARERAGR